MIEPAGQPMDQSISCDLQRLRPGRSAHRAFKASASATCVPSLNVPILARHAIYGQKPVIFEIGQSMTREHPDAPTIVLKQRIRRIIRQSIRLAEE